MKRIVIILIGLISVAYGQGYAPTSAKTRFVNGIALGTKLDSYFAAADSNAIYWRADSALMAKYKGTARALAFADALGSYKLVADTFFTNGYTTRGRTKQVIDSLGAAVGNGFVTIATDQNVSGKKSFTQNQIWFAANQGGQTVGGNSSGIFFGNTNTIGGTQNIVIGFEARGSGNQGISIGAEARSGSSGANNNISIGQKAGVGLTTGSSNIFLGNSAGRYYGSGSIFNYSTPTNSILIGNNTVGATDTDDNTIVIGQNAASNGSNTVTIGNSSVVGNYFNGSLFSTETNRVTKTDNTVFGQQFYDANKGWFIGYVSNTADSAFQINYDGSYNTKLRNAITINKNGDVFIPSGNLGVGTTTAAYKLDVVGTGNFTGALSGSSLSMSGGGSFGDNISIAAGKRLQFSSTAYMTPEDNIQGARVKTGGGFIVESATMVADAIYNTTVGGTNRDVFVDNTGLIGYVSSFRASKKNITPISNTDWLHNLNPVTFNYRVKDSLGNYTDSAYKELEYGLIAEEVEPINKEMVFYDVDSSGNKKLRGVHYSKLIIPLLSVIQEQKKNADALEKRVADLEAKLEALLKLPR